MEHIKNLNLSGSLLSGDQQLDNISGFCTLNLENNDVLKLKEIRPIQELIISSNSDLFKLDPLKSNDYQPFKLDLHQSDNLECNHYFKHIIDNTSPVPGRINNPVPPFTLANGEDAEILSCGIRGFQRQLTLPNGCKPNKPKTFQVFQNTSITDFRYLTWTKNDAHDYQRWGVTHFLLEAFENDVLVNEYILSINDPFNIELDSFVPDTYSLKVCIDEKCSDPRIVSADQITQGYAKTINHSIDLAQNLQ